MVGWWAKDPRIPEYINRLEDAQKKVDWASLPITNAWLAAIATMSLLLAGSFPKLRLDWDGLSPLQDMAGVEDMGAKGPDRRVQTTCIRLPQRRLRQRLCRHRSPRHHLLSSTPAPLQAVNATNHSLPTLSELESHLDNMAFAVTNKKAVLNSLISSNASLTKITTEKLTKLEKLLLELKSTGHRPAPGTPQMTVPSNSHGVSQLHAAIKYKWVPGAFCSIHGWGVGAGHTSAKCKGKKHGHVDSATRNNSQGPGATKNKGWDDFLKA